MNTKSLLIKKHSAIIQCSVKELTLMQRKMINGLIFIAQKNPESEIFETNAEYLKKICGFNLESNSYMQEQLKKIKEIRNNKDLTYWLEYFTYGLALEIDKVKQKVLKLSQDLKIQRELGQQVALSERQIILLEVLQNQGQMTIQGNTAIIRQ